MTVSPQDELFTHTEGYFVTKALLAAWRLGLLADAVDHDKIDPDAWAAAHHCDPHLVRSLLAYLVVRDFFEDDHGHYRLSERGRRTAPYFGYLPMHVGAYEPVFGSLEAILRQQKVYGENLHRAEHELVGGMSAMEEHLLHRLTALTDDLTFHSVLDLGCGSARLLSQLLTRDPHIRGVGIDREATACDEARATMAREGLADRATVLRGDASRLRDLPADALADVDLAIAMFVMHEINHQRPRDEVITCLRDVAQTIGPNGRLLMVEVSRIDGDHPRPGLRFVPEYQLVHDFSRQRLASKTDWETMLAEAGMTVLKTEPAGMCEAFCFVAAPT